MQGEVPVLFLIRGKINVLIRVRGASAVGDPDVIALVNQAEGQGLAGLIEEPGAALVEEAVLELDGLLLDGGA